MKIIALFLFFFMGEPILAQSNTSEPSQGLISLIVLGDYGEPATCMQIPSISANPFRQLEAGTLILGERETVFDQNGGPWIHVSIDGDETLDCFLFTMLVAALDPIRPFSPINQLISGFRSTSFTQATSLHKWIFEDRLGGVLTEDLPEMQLLRLKSLSFIATNTIGLFQLYYRPDIVEWVEQHKAYLVYNEPPGQWIVPANHFWNLHDKYREDPNTERGRQFLLIIADTAIGHRFPGECEGYLDCNLSEHHGVERNGRIEYIERHTDGHMTPFFLWHVIEDLEQFIEYGDREVCGENNRLQLNLNRVFSTLNQVPEEGFSEVNGGRERLHSVFSHISQFCGAGHNLEPQP